MGFNDILVPTDFSESSLVALEHGLSILDSGGQITLLHVIDADFGDRYEAMGFGVRADAMRKLRERAKTQIVEIQKRYLSPTVKIDTTIAEGKPYLEILRIARDFDFQVIVMGKHGRAEHELEDLLFGSTAERVVRGATLPVLCVPNAEQSGA